jgi:hypothetical protein
LFRAYQPAAIFDGWERGGGTGAERLVAVDDGIRRDRGEEPSLAYAGASNPYLEIKINAEL